MSSNLRDRRASLGRMVAAIDVLLKFVFECGLLIVEWRVRKESEAGVERFVFCSSRWKLVEKFVCGICKSMLGTQSVHNEEFRSSFVQWLRYVSSESAFMSFSNP